MMHICFITSEYPVPNQPHGGVGTFTQSIGRELSRHGIEVSVIRLAPVKQETVSDDHGVSVYLIPKSGGVPLAFLWNSARIRKTIVKIHAQRPVSVVETPELGLAFLNKIPGIKYVIRMHGGHHYFAKAEKRPLETRKVLQEKWSFAKADAVAAVSRYVAETTRELLQLGDRNIKVIYNPVDTTHFYKADPTKIIPHTIFFAGSLVEKKGIRQLVQAIDFLVDDFPDIQLNIAGRDGTIPGTKQSFRPVLEAAISDKSRPHIRFLGVVPHTEIPEFIEKAQVCCYPSHMEAMPIAWLEVLGMGKVFLGSITGPGPEAVLDGKTGFLVNPHEPEQIAAKIRYIFDHYDQALEMAASARARILSEFNVETLVQENIAFYRSL